MIFLNLLYRKSMISIQIWKTFYFFALKAPIIYDFINFFVILLWLLSASC